MSEKWDKRFLGMAEYISTWSKDPSTQVGAVIVDKDKRIVSLGFNGLPQRRTTEQEKDILCNRDLKLELIIHAEINALLFAKQNLEGCTLYTCPFAPCSKCSSPVIQSGIDRVVSYENNNPRWVDSLELAKANFLDAGVEYVLYKKKEPEDDAVY